MTTTFSYKINVSDIEITPELEEYFELHDSKIVRTIATIQELKGIMSPADYALFPSDQKVLLVANYEVGTLDVDVLL